MWFSEIALYISGMLIYMHQNNYSLEIITLQPNSYYGKFNDKGEVKKLGKTQAIA